MSDDAVSLPGHRMTPIVNDAWDAVIGQPAAVTAIRRALASDEVAHAWLFVGPADVGQRELARALAMALNCTDAPAPDRGCGQCTTCTRIARGVHPSVEDLEPLDLI